jgi:hypothetical protein
MRRRWRSLVGLGLIAGIAAGVAIAAVAGARRTDTAWERLRDATNAADAIVFTSQAGIYDPAELGYDTFESLPYVTSAGAFGLFSGVSDDVGQFGGFVPTGGEWLDTLDTPRIIEGRLPRRDAPDEVVLSRPRAGGAAAEAGIGLGSEIHAHLFTAAQQVEGRFEQPEGPELTLRVVGVSDSPFNLAAIPGDGDIFMSPSFRKAYGDGVSPFSNLLVRLADPATDMRKLEEEVARKYPGRGVPVYDLHAAGKRVTTATDFERSGLVLFALAVAVAGLVIVGQALTRAVRAASNDVSTLVALGFSRRDAIGSLLFAHVPAIAAATFVAAVTAILLSPRFPIGLGRRVEIDPGLHVDALVLAVGVGGLALVLTAAVAATALRVTRDAGRRGTAGRKSSLVVEGLRGLGAPVPVTTGASFALEPGRGSRTLPTRPAVVGAIVGVVGVVGAMTLSDGMTDAIHNAARFGAVWDAEAFFAGDGPGESARSMATVLSSDEDVEAATRFARVPLPVGGVVLPTYALDGPLRFELLDGRRPRTAREVALGPDSAKAIDAQVGDQITVGAIDVDVVGLALLPTTAHSSFDQGAWLTAEGIGDALPSSQVDSIRDEAASYGITSDLTAEDLAFFYGGIFLSFGEGVDHQAAIERLGGMLEGVAVEPSSGPADQSNLDNVRHLPTLFAVFASLLATAAIAHVSSSVVRRRRGDLAVMRALGWTPSQARWSVVWQATVLAIVGVIAGVPLGIALGRVIWRAVADSTPMIYVAPVALTALLLATPVALIASNALAVWPARIAARLRPAEVLRAE